MKCSIATNIRHLIWNCGGKFNGYEFICFYKLKCLLCVCVDVYLIWEVGIINCLYIYLLDTLVIVTGCTFLDLKTEKKTQIK